jgi:hypothetical protein
MLLERTQHLPKVAESPLSSALCCFPPASPVFVPAAGKQTKSSTDASDSLIVLKNFGAGEGIRTLDPNLGKIEGGKHGTWRALTIARHSKGLTDVPALIGGMATRSQSPKLRRQPS